MAEKCLTTWGSTGDMWEKRLRRSRSACTCAGRVMCHFQQLWSLKPALKAVQKTWPYLDSYLSDTHDTRLRKQQKELMETLTCDTANWVNNLKKKVQQHMNPDQDTDEDSFQLKWLDSICLWCQHGAWPFAPNWDVSLIRQRWSLVSCQHLLNTIRHLVWQISTAMETWQRPANNSTNVMATMMAGDRWRRDVSEKSQGV